MSSEKNLGIAIAEVLKKKKRYNGIIVPSSLGVSWLEICTHVYIDKKKIPPLLLLLPF